jgi:hypothetical protein
LLTSPEKGMGGNTSIVCGSARSAAAQLGISLSFSENQ